MHAAALAGEVTHAAVAGDSLWSIAAKFRVSVSALEARNHLTDASILQLGQTIVIGETPAAPVRRVSRIITHTVGAAEQSGPAFRVNGRIAPSPRHAASKLVRLGRPSTMVAARNAVWVATHTGMAPAPPTAEPFSIAQRIVAFDERVTHTALRFLGVPYVWGGTSFNGVDCSGFVQTVFERNGISLPRTADSQFEVGSRVSMRDLEPGDLVFFETYAVGASHVGIYVGDGQFVHASSNGVRIDNLSQAYYASRYLGARRLIH